MNGRFHFYFEQEDAPGLKLALLEEALTQTLKSQVGLAVEVVFVDGAEIRRLNREQRGVDAVTDVLSFPALENIKGKVLKKEDFPLAIDEEGNLFLGSVAICLQRAQEQAEEYGHSYQRELHYLLVHGTMHCLGHDHVREDEKAQMREAEEEVLAKIGITREED